MNHKLNRMWSVVILFELLSVTETSEPVVKKDSKGSIDRGKCSKYFSTYIYLLIHYNLVTMKKLSTFSCTPEIGHSLFCSMKHFKWFRYVCFCFVSILNNMWIPKPILYHGHGRISKWTLLHLTSMNDGDK